jgi:hypothetical protein
MFKMEKFIKIKNLFIKINLYLPFNFDLNFIKKHL